MCREYKLASTQPNPTQLGFNKNDSRWLKNIQTFSCLNWRCQLLPCFDGKLYLVHWWKMFIVLALSNMETWNQASRDPKTQPSRKRCVLVHCLAGRCESLAIPTGAWKWSFRAFSWSEASTSIQNYDKNVLFLEGGQLLGLQGAVIIPSELDQNLFSAGAQQ